MQQVDHEPFKEDREAGFFLSPWDAYGMNAMFLAFNTRDICLDESRILAGVQMSPTPSFHVIAIAGLPAFRTAIACSRQ